MIEPADLRPYIKRLVSRTDLSAPEIDRAFASILGGSAGDAQIAAFLVALSMKGESSPELRAMIDATRGHATRITPKVPGPLVDTCGTGGDSMRSFNISTAAAIVAAAAGAAVAKHGNRSASGLCGSADFLEHVGFSLDSRPAQVQDCIERTGFGFLFAPVFHPSMKNVANARKALGIRTVFNMIGPLCNPCTNLSGQVIGVYEPRLIDLFADAYRGYVCDVMIVHAADGFDELSNTCENDVLLIRGEASPQRLRIGPKALNMPRAKPEELAVTSRDDAISSTLQTICGTAPAAKQDVVLLNASAALLVARLVDDLKEGIEMARSAIKSGKASEKLGQVMKLCGKVEKLEQAEKSLQPA